MLYTYVNKKIIPASKATISVFDRGLVLGDGLFETLRAINFIPEFLSDHYKRLQSGAEKLRISLPLSKKMLGTTIYTLCKKSKLPDATVRITLTRGEYLGNLSIDPKVPPTLIISVTPVKGLPESLYVKGVKVAISTISKAATSGIDSSVKTTNYLANIFAKVEADEKKAYEAILLGRKGEIAELTTSSFFAVKGKTLYTPPLDEGILPGITRQHIIQVCKDSGIPLVEKKIWPHQIHQFKEAFLTSSVRGVVPICQIEEQIIAKGVPGPLTQAIRLGYLEHCIKDRAKSAKFLF